MELQVEQLIARGRQAFERRDYVAALADFRETLANYPNYADIHQLSGVCLAFLGQPEAALEQFDQALDLNNAYVEAHLNRALTLNELGRFDEARSAFERAWEEECSDGGPFSAAVSARLANAHTGLADLYVEAGAPEQAVDQYRVAIALRPRFVDVRNKLAHALMQLGNLDEAEVELQAALEEHPQFAAARVSLGLVHYRRGDNDRAIEEWRAALATAPGNAQARAFLAVLGHVMPTPRPAGG
jgi:tetratricopeptide (TPR) repeat protein